MYIHKKSKKKSKSKSMVSIQNSLEDGLIIKCLSDITDKNNIKIIHDSVGKLKKVITSTELQSRVEIGILSTPYSFSCLVIDDDVYFFPFLSAEESNISPLILCDAKRKIGKPIIKHFENMWTQGVFYISKSLNECSFINDNKKYSKCVNKQD